MKIEIEDVPKEARGRVAHWRATVTYSERNYGFFRYQRKTRDFVRGYPGDLWIELGGTMQARRRLASALDNQLLVSMCTGFAQAHAR